MRSAYVYISPAQLVAGGGQQDVDYVLDRPPFTRYFWNGDDFQPASGGPIIHYTAAELSAMATAGTLTPLAEYVASDTGDEYKADDAYTLRPINNATYPVTFTAVESTSYFGTSVNAIKGRDTSLIPDGENLNGFAAAIGNGEIWNSLPLAAVVPITGSITGDVLTVSAVGDAVNPNGTNATGAVMRGHFITGHANIPANTYIKFDPTDTGSGGAGTYKLSASATGSVPGGTAMSLTCAGGIGGVLERTTDPYAGPSVSADADARTVWMLTIDPTHRVTSGHGRSMLQSGELALRKRYRAESQFGFYDQGNGSWQSSNSTTAEPTVGLLFLTQLNGNNDYDAAQYVVNGPFGVVYERGTLIATVRSVNEVYAVKDGNGIWSWQDGDRNNYFQTQNHSYALKGKSPVMVDFEFFLDERMASEGGRGWLKCWINRQLWVDYVGPTCYPAGRNTGNVGQVFYRFGMYDTTYAAVADNTLCSAVRSTALQRNLAIKYSHIREVV